MLVNLKEILKMAEENSVAIGAFNAPNLESLLAVIGAAEELNLPVIIQFAQCHDELVPLSVMGPIMVDMAKKASVPVCVHLDHGETLEYIKNALEMGFSSVMYDGSLLDYEENESNTIKVVKMAAQTGASVEAELGSMGGPESGSNENGESSSAKIYTNPKQAKTFVENTGIDALACSFGTSHGVYLAEPMLDFGIVYDVRKETDGIPIVMHGGSGVSKDDFRAAIKAGVRKINYFTYMDKAGGASLPAYISEIGNDKPIFFTNIVKIATEEMKKNVIAAMKIFGNIY